MKRHKIGKEHASKNHISTITIKYDVGFGNGLYLRGSGAGLSWDKGKRMRNVGPDTWVWETDATFTECEFKALVNDEAYEEGSNHQLLCGKNVQYSPNFSKVA